MDARITAADKLRALPEGSFLTLEKLSTGGSLQARRLSSAAVQFYWRYSLDGRTYREPLGVYDASSPPKKLEPTARGFGLAAARERCRTLAAAHGANRNAGGLREIKAKERREHVEAKAAAEAKPNARSAACSMTMWGTSAHRVGAARVRHRAFSTSMSPAPGPPSLRCPLTSWRRTKCSTC